MGLKRRLADVASFASDLGDANHALLVVRFDDNCDGTVDLPLFVELDVFGLA